MELQALHSLIHPKDGKQNNPWADANIPPIEVPLGQTHLGVKEMVYVHLFQARAHYYKNEYERQRKERRKERRRQGRRERKREHSSKV